MTINRDFFFDYARGYLFGGKLRRSQVEGLTAILDYWEARLASKDDRWLAYALGTAFHETDQSMGPIREYGRGRGRTYGKATPPYGEVYYGRGLVQLTWDYNYKAMSAVTGVDLLRSPDLALELKHAVPIMFVGMEQGTFTGAGFARFFGPAKANWVGARRIINGADKAQLIAGHARQFYAALSYTV